MVVYKNNCKNYTAFKKNFMLKMKEKETYKLYFDEAYKYTKETRK